MTNKCDGHIMHTCMNTICECVQFFSDFSPCIPTKIETSLTDILYQFRASVKILQAIDQQDRDIIMNHHEALCMLLRQVACTRFCQVYICGLSRMVQDTNFQ